MRTILAALAALTLTGIVSAQTEVNLALVANGGMPTALASAPNMAFSAQKAADANPATGWVSEAGVYPIWLRIEWRKPERIDRISLSQFPGSPFQDVGAIGEYSLEVLRAGEWVPVATGQAGPADQPQVALLAQPVETTAVRLIVNSGAAARVAVSEFEVFGPKPVLPMDYAPKWKGGFIWAEPSLVVPRREPTTCYLRRSFTIEDPATIREAWLAVCAFDRLNALWINTHPVADHISYAGGALRLPEVRQVPRELFVAGENVICAAAEDLYEVGSRGLLAELVIAYADGTRTVIPTDTEWKGHHDQGVVPDWRKPGFNERGWANCTVVGGPNGSWHWAWNTLHPVMAPEETLTVTGITLDPAHPAPGATARCTVSFECERQLSTDYAVILRLGQHSFIRNHDFELWGSVIAPEQARTSTWGPGAHSVTIELEVPAEAPRETPATLLVSIPEKAAGLQCNLGGCRADAYGVHFSIPVNRGPVTDRPRATDFPGAEIRSLNGNPTLHVAGRPTSPVLWASSYGNYRRFAEYASTGVKLYRLNIEGDVIVPDDEADRYYPWWFEQIDRIFESALSIDPDLLLLPAVQMDPSPQVLFDDPSEQMLSGRGQLVIPLAYYVPDRGQVRPTFMSQDWRRRGAEGLKRLVEHMRAQPYAGNIVGVCLFAGRAGENYWGGNEFNVFMNEQGAYDAKSRAEWTIGDFSMAARRTFRDFLIRKYGTDERLQAAWRDENARFDDVLDPAEFQREAVCNVLTRADKPADAGAMRDPLEPGVGAMPMDYLQCFSEAMIDTFAAWGQGVKEASDNKLIAGCFYGYAIPEVFTSVPGFGGHGAVTRACETPSLDFYVAPAEYDGSRRAGGHYWHHNIIDSLRLHNKLPIYEQDTRTYLAEMMPKTFSLQETLSVLKRDCAKCITDGAGWWWLEFASEQRGAAAREWFIDEDIQAFAGHIKRVNDFAMTLPDRGPAAQVAVFYHGPTVTAQDIFDPARALNIDLARLTLVNNMQNTGVPYDLYNLADIPLLEQSGLLNQYRLCIFLNPFYLTPDERQSLELCKSDGRVLVWLWAPGIAQVGKALSPELVTDVTGISGINWKKRRVAPVCRISAPEHPLFAGMPAGEDIAPVPYPPGSTWERYGNEIGPVLYVDPAAAGDAEVLGSYVVDGALREDMGALCLREVRQGGALQWASFYSAVPYLSRTMLRNLARYAGAHVYRDSEDILYTDRHFVCIHTGAQPATDTLHLPRTTPVYDIFARVIVSDSTDTVQLDIPPYTTALYYLGDPATFKAAVE
jgi:hypothetical protein